MLERLGLLALSWSPARDAAGKCSLVSDTVLLSPEAETLREPLLQRSRYTSAPASRPVSRLSKTER